MSRQAWRWFAVAGMMIVTFAFGTDAFSSQNTRAIIRMIMEWLLGPGLPKEMLGTGEGWLRKTAHFIEYALLAFVWFRALRGDEPRPWKWSWAATALVVTAAWAAVDELQQGFVSTQRTGNPGDVLLDSCGAATGLALVWLYWTTSTKASRSVPSPLAGEG
jgi:VanZ family protein